MLFKSILQMLLPIGLLKLSLDTGSNAPDPAATAAAQGTANVEAARVTAALNRPDQITPFGNLTWQNLGKTFNQSAYDTAYNNYQQQLAAWQTAQGNSEGGGYGGVQPVAPDQKNFYSDEDKWQSTITLDPRVQALIDAQLGGSQGLADASQGALQRVQDTFAQGLDTTGITQRIGVGDALTRAQNSIWDPRAAINRADSMAGDARTIASRAGQNFGNQLANPLNYEGAPAMPTSDDDVRSRIEQALYQRQTSRLDPRYQQTQSDLDSRLAAQGITQGSEAYNREQDNLARDRTDAYQQAMLAAITGGEQALQQEFQRDLSARQQGVNEANNIRQSGLAEYGTAAQTALGAQTGLGQMGQLGLQTATTTPGVANQYYNLYGDARGAELGEQTQIRNQILNELNALRTGSQVQMPQFGSGQSGAQVTPAPVAQSVWNAYNADASSQNAMMGGLTTLGAAAMMAPAGTFSWLSAI